MKPIKLHNLSELLEAAKINRKTAYSYIKAGKLKAVKIGRAYKVSEAEMDRFLTEGTETA